MQSAWNCADNANSGRVGKSRANKRSGFAAHDDKGIRLFHDGHLQIIRFADAALFAFVAGGLLAALPLTAIAQTSAISYRSVGDVRPRLSDDHDRPYFRQTQSHRGFEIREPQFTVIAQTSAADAQWAAGHVAAAWQQAGSLADHWTRVHQQPDFGLNSLQVVVTG